MSATREAVTGGRRETAPGIIDCDVHNALPFAAALKPYLPERWHVYYDQGTQIGRKGHGNLMIGTRRMPHFFRGDSVPDSGGIPGSDYELLRIQLLDGHNVSRAMLTPLDCAEWTAYGEAAAAYATALNTWMVEEWFERDSRLFGSITIAAEDGHAAAAEIERAAADPRFISVFVPIQTREGLGHPNYRPILAAAHEAGLPINLHVGGFSGTHLATGYPTYHLEHHALYTQVYQVQVTSLVYGGVFERFPRLQVVLAEGGAAWLPSLLWRLDRAWESMREHAPHLERRPSEVVREHFWLTTQPFDEPDEPEQVLELFDQLDMNDRLVFSSDYPHWDFDGPDRVLPASLIGKELRDRIFVRNAQALFDFDRS